MAEREQHIDSDRARAGTTPHIARYVLAMSLALVVLIFAVIYLAF